MKEHANGSFRITRNHKILVLSALLVTFMLLFIPLWQMGVNRSLDLGIRYENARLVEIDSEERAIRKTMASLQHAAETENILLSMQEREVVLLSSK